MNIFEILQWRGMLYNIMPGTKEYLQNNMATLYLGIDPTADSLHVGHLAGIMLLKHFQSAGHRPIALLGGATGMIGDPSGKSKERNLLDEESLRYNQERIKTQLENFIDFKTPKANQAVLVNNYDWMRNYSFLGFIRDIGKHITVNYMLAKDSVKSRISRPEDDEEADGLSFTEFTYQLVQAYDYLELYRKYGCKLQVGGSDQWGNITTGTELIRRKEGEKAYALTMPLITKADGGKFGKTEEGNIWLDPQRTSPYKFFQFWLNVSDEDAEKFIKIFTDFSREKIEELITRHREQPHKRELQKELARYMTIMAHSQQEWEKAVEASSILFGKGTKEQLANLDEQTFREVFSGVPNYQVDRQLINQGVNVLELLAEKTTAFGSKGEVKRLIKDNGLNLNQQKVKSMNYTVTAQDLINQKYLLFRKGKKQYMLIEVNPPSD